MHPFNGLNMGLGNLMRLSGARTRSISPENFSGAKGEGGKAVTGTGASCAQDLGVGWKVSPSVEIQPGETFTLGEIHEAGAIQHIWLTCYPAIWRHLIFRIYWDGEEQPSVEAPVGDFFCNGWQDKCNVNSLPVAVNPAGGMNSYWQMPFRHSALVTMENTSSEKALVYYQIDYTHTEVPEDAAYFHAQWRRSNPVGYKDVHTIVDGIRGKGQYVGVYLAWQVNNNGWWGEGEVKFYLDGDEEYPTICGTGTEDYFGGAFNWEHPAGQYGTYSTPFLGMHQAIKPDGLYLSQPRFGMYRWHVMDPIRFEHNLRVTVQDIGWRSGRRYLPQQSDISSTAFWYQAEPHAPFPGLPDNDAREVT
ncbi:glycoside hydrolase family 172 protein [Cohnella cellulosilytica]|uniref:Glycoside hydrolase family 172 protein n=1 Tax=Cohnella cellulosilytica TaxID=986710 RepID=A0ABW2F7Y7_9BACL